MWPDCFVIIYKLYKDYLTHWKNLAAITLLQASVCKALRDFLILIFKENKYIGENDGTFLHSKIHDLGFYAKE